ncbi:MAG: GNAT family N-acetyltransferase [Legionellaceae bacterium]|nr:GNAT family N-acetyltransferase [Legionellaceae bacterium]
MINVTLCTESNKQIISDLCQFYFYDLDTHSNLATIEYQQGHYEKMAYFDNYWEEENRFPYLINQNQEPVGFALIHDITVNPKANWKLAEFFVMRPYQRQGIGQFFVEQLFKMHRGIWEVSVLKDNGPALHFWEKQLIGSQQLTHDHFEQYVFFEILK